MHYLNIFWDALKTTARSLPGNPLKTLIILGASTLILLLAMMASKFGERWVLHTRLLLSIRNLN